MRSKSTSELIKLLNLLKVMLMPQIRSPYVTRSYRCYKSSFTKRIEQELVEIHRSGLSKIERVINSTQGPEITLSNTNTTKYINFCSNNYLGLSNHPAVIRTAHHAIYNRGFGLSSGRIICGTQDIHKELEKKISLFHKTDDTLTYSSCFDANAGIFEQLYDEKDAVISDSLNHASLIDGIRLSKAKRYKYSHIDMSHLESILLETSTTARNRLIVTDGTYIHIPVHEHIHSYNLQYINAYLILYHYHLGIFSMDGDVAPMRDLIRLAALYDAQVLIITGRLIRCYILYNMYTNICYILHIHIHT